MTPSDSSQFPTDYNSVSGSATGTGGRSSPAQGAMFVFLALNLPKQNVQASVPGRNGKSKPNIGAIVGSVLAGVAVIGLAGLCLLLWKRHKRTRSPTLTSGLDPFPTNSGISRTGNTYDSYPWSKGYQDSHSQHAKRSALMPSNSPAPNIPTQQVKSGFHQHFRSRSTPVAGLLNTDEPSASSTIFVSPTSKFPSRGSPAPRDSTTQSPSPQLRPATLPGSTSSVSLLNPVPSRVDVTRRLRDEVEMLWSEMAEMRAQRMYNVNEAPPQYNQGH
ncbi:hypothetical protein BD779DRAFT_1791467 [Infundibulicybe gibba]|nr:hypothetical protein BD779DRAFT_1791467 [Infundibulicybe gibba]